MLLGRTLDSMDDQLCARAGILGEVAHSRVWSVLRDRFAVIAGLSRFLQA